MGRISRRLFRYGLLPLVASTTMICIPRKDQLPPGPLLNYRVLCEGSWRLVKCVYTAGLVALDYKWHVSDASSQEEWNITHERAAQRLVDLAENNGGMYVKIGQGFAAQNHLLPSAYCRIMAKLQNAVLFRPFSEVRAVVEQDLNAPIETVFSEFSETPIAAASLAQVHVATLRGTGTKVAVKVQYIDIVHRFDGDMLTIRSLLRVAGLLFPGFDFGRIVKQAEGVLRDELDFVQEARNQERAGKEFEEHFGKRVTVPKIIWEVTRPRVMVSEFIDGAKSTDVARIQQLGLRVKEVAELIVDAFALQLFVTGFVHADPHPGNMLVRPLKAGSGDAQLVVLDHGLYVRLTQAEREDISQLWTAMVTHDDTSLRAICKRCFGIDNFKLLASMFLQFPYDLFSPDQRLATKGDVDATRAMATKYMDETTEILEALPKAYPLVLRNLTTVRSCNKLLGSPTSRTLRMLQYSIRTSHKLSWWSCQQRAWAAWFRELWQQWLLDFAMWRDPSIRRQLDELTVMG